MPGQPGISPHSTSCDVAGLRHTGQMAGMTQVVTEAAQAVPAPPLRALIASYHGYRHEGLPPGRHRGLPSP
jgi:hypothetical protein